MDKRNQQPAATFATEKAKAAKKPKDAITMDAIAAEKAGMSYGKYKALYPHTKEANEAKLTTPEKEPTSPASPTSPTRRTYNRRYVRVCPVCRNSFITGNAQRIYCSDTCKNRKNGEKYRKQIKDKEAVTL